MQIAPLAISYRKINIQISNFPLDGPLGDSPKLQFYDPGFYAYSRAQKKARLRVSRNQSGLSGGGNVSEITWDLHGCGRGSGDGNGCL
jgi:hypothetical protein